MKTTNLIHIAKLVILISALSFYQRASAQLTYSGPYTFSAGTAISPIYPTGTGATPQVSLFASGFYHPAGMAIDASNNIYLADQFNNQVKRIDPSGTVVATWGSGSAGSTSGYYTSASFYYPGAVAIDNTGTSLYVADYGNNMIRIINLSNGYVSNFAGSGTAGEIDATWGSAQFNGPLGIIVGDGGNIYVADYTGQTIRKINPSTGLVSTIAGSSGSIGTTDAVGTNATFDYPSSIKEDAAGNLYVTDRSSDIIRKINASTGLVTTIAGSQYAESSFDGTGLGAGFYRPSGLVFDNAGNIYITDYLGNKIRKLNLSSGGVTSIAGSGAAGNTNGSAPSASFNGPFGITRDASGNLFVSDIVNNSIRKITTAGVTISPALPTGLVMDPMTGVITGTPVGVSPATPYTVTVVNGGGTFTSTFSLAVLPNSSYSTFNPGNAQNFIITYTPHTAISDITQFASTTVDQLNLSIQYIDGLGRPSQTVQWQGSPNRNDVIQPMAYDQFGRESIKYLPYANNPARANDGSYKTDAITTQQSAFYGSSTWAANITPIPTPTSNTSFEASPGDRPLEQGAPGNSWQLGNHTVKTIYGLNDASAINSGTGFWAKNYGVSITSGIPALIDNGSYAPNTLYVTVVKDENWQSGQTYAKDHTIEEYKDQDGNLVLKRTFNGSNTLSTYYVYDNYGKLTFVLPPGANPDGSLSSAANQATLDTWCYQFRYDYRNRLVEKKIPAKGWEFMVYNTQDQLTMTQDANQRSKTPQVWSYTKYDLLARVVLTGEWLNGGTTADANLSAPDHTSFNALQSAFNNPSIQKYESRDNSSATGYTNVSIPTNAPAANVYTINYYDDYNFPGNPYSSWGGYQSTPTGLATANKTVVLKPDGTYGPMLWTVNYYDDKGRAVQIFKQHYLGSTYNTGSYSTEQTVYNFDNSISANTEWQFKAGTETVAFGNQYYYDHVGRKTQTWQSMQLGSNGWQQGILLSVNEYNEIGQLKTKHLDGSTLGGPYLQDVNYTYNERGWLRTSGTSASGVATNLFNMDLRYDNPTSGPQQQFNGNVAQMFYNGQNSGSKQFNYTYDALNRLTISMPTSGNLDETVTYDNMGNISTLTRGGFGLLSYPTYAGNQLINVTGYSPRSYAYDPNGNATSDGQSKGIEYNMLDLPRRVSSGGSQIATYTYDASGVKLQNSGTDGTWDYVGDVVYHTQIGSTTPAIELVQTEEGKAIPNGTGFSYRYNLKDHLGNVRVTFDRNTSTNQAEVLQEDEYYAFGLRHGLYDNSNNNRYLYNGKEVQIDLADQYDYGARFYDPVIGRFTAIDAFAVKYASVTPYQYAGLNPISNIDINGDSVWTTTSTIKDKNGNTHITHTTHITGKTIDVTGSGGADALASGLNSMYRNTSYSETSSNKDGTQTTNSYNIDASFTVANSVNDIKASDNVVAIVDKISVNDAENKGIAAGVTNQVMGNLSYVGFLSNFTTLLEAAYHEVGHQLGLPDRFNGNKSDPMDYHGGTYSGNKLTEADVKTIYQNNRDFPHYDHGSNRATIINRQNNGVHNDVSSSARPYVGARRYGMTILNPIK